LNIPDFWCPKLRCLGFRRLPILIAFIALLVLILPSLNEIMCGKACLISAASTQAKTIAISGTTVSLEPLQSDKNQPALPRHLLTCQHAHCRDVQACVAGPHTTFACTIAARPNFAFDEEQPIVDAPLLGLERPPRRLG